MALLKLESSKLPINSVQNKYLHQPSLWAQTDVLNLLLIWVLLRSKCLTQAWKKNNHSQQSYQPICWTPTGFISPLSSSYPLSPCISFILLFNNSTNLAAINSCRITHMYQLTFHGSGVQVQLSQVLCSGPYKAAIKVCNKSAFSSGVQGTFPSSKSCWQNSFPCAI